MNLLCEGVRFKVVLLGTCFAIVLSLGLLMVHCYYEFALQGNSAYGCFKGLLGLGLIMVHLYYAFSS
jgi:hypothetical protein